MPSALEDFEKLGIALDTAKSWDDMQKANEEIKKAWEHMEKQLSDNSLRAKLLAVLPNIVDRLTVDLENRRFAVKYLDGTQGPFHVV